MRFAASCIFSLWLSVIAHCQTWQGISPFPGISRDDAVGETVNDHAFFGTGFGTGFVFLNDWWKYSFSSDAWTQVTSLPSLPRQYAASCVHNENIFIGAGIANTGICTPEIWKYHSNTDTWSFETNFPGGGRQAPVMVAVYDKIYMGLGRKDTVYYNDWWMYDVYLKTWQQLTNVPFANRYDAESAECAGEIYVGLGRNDTQGFSDWWKFNPVTLQWEQKLNYPGNACVYTSSAVSGEWITVYGGTDFTNAFSDECYHYHVKTDQWSSTAAIPAFPRKGGALLSYDGNYFYVSGIDSTNFRTPDVWKLDWSTQVLQDIIFYPNPSSDWLCMNAHISYSTAYVLEIYSMLSGQHVYSVSPDYFNSCFGIQKLSPGFYMARLRNESTFFNSFRFLKQ